MKKQAATTEVEMLPRARVSIPHAKGAAAFSGADQRSGIVFTLGVGVAVGEAQIAYARAQDSWKLKELSAIPATDYAPEGEEDEDGADEDAGTPKRGMTPKPVRRAPAVEMDE